MGSRVGLFTTRMASLDAHNSNDRRPAVLDFGSVQQRAAVTL